MNEKKMTQADIDELKVEFLNALGIGWIAEKLTRLLGRWAR